MISRRTIVASFSLLLFALAVVVVARRAADAATTADIAVIESDTWLATAGQLQLGAYSRFQWHHPGPLAFYALAPFYSASGFRAAGLSAGALVINLAAIVFIAAVLLERGRPVTAAITSVLLVVFAWRATEAIASPWNPHLAVLPFAALIVAAAAAVSGTPRLLAAAAFWASMAAQSHVALLPSAVAVGAAAFAGAARGRIHRRASYVAALAVLLVVWLLPLVEQMTAPTGNLTLLWNYFVHEPHKGQTVGVALSAWSDFLSGILRPDFYVAHGWAWVESPVKWAEIVASLQMIGLAIVAVLALGRRRPFDAALAVMLGIASICAFWSATRVDSPLEDHAVFWMTGIGILNLGVVIGSLLDSVPPIAQSRFASGRTAQAAVCIMVMVVAVLGINELRRQVAASRTPGGEKDTVAAVAEDVRTYMTANRVVRPLIRIDQDAWGIAAGVIVYLQKRGLPVAVEDDWLVMFNPRFADTHDETTAITIANRTRHVQLTGTPGDRVISSHDPIFAHASAHGARANR